MLGRLLDLLPSETLRGYENPELVDTIFRKTMLFRPTGSWPEMSGASTVLDFGGGCGIHYKQANHPTLKWAVVETPAMVERAKELETDRLRFFTDIREAASWLGDIDVMHSNGAVQYVPEPLSTVRELAELRAKRMLWFRLFLGSGSETQVSRLDDNGPGHIDTARKKVAYDFTRISRAEFLAAHQGYHVEDYGEDWFKFVR